MPNHPKSLVVMICTGTGTAMSARSLDGDTVLVIGAGIMGAGIAQVAALAGHPVRLYDSREGAAADARHKLTSTLDGLAGKGKLRRRRRDRHARPHSTRSAN